MEWAQVTQLLPSLSSQSQPDVLIWSHRHPFVRERMALHLVKHLREVSYIKEEKYHRIFLAMSTKALLLHSLGGDIGDMVDI
jgi:hypothetical protein